MTWNVFPENNNGKEIVEYNLFNHGGLAEEVEEMLKKQISKDEFE